MNDCRVAPLRGLPNLRSLRAFLSGNEGGDLILPPAWKGLLTESSARTVPAHNFRAAIGYLLMRIANFEYRSVPDADSTVYNVTVKQGDSLDKIARAQGSTVEVLRQLNPKATVLRSGQVLKYQKASVQRVISGWKHMSTASIARYYNATGDSPYLRKLDYAMSLVLKGKAALCEQ